MTLRRVLEYRNVEHGHGRYHLGDTRSLWALPFRFLNALHANARRDNLSILAGFVWANIALLDYAALYGSFR